MAFTTLFFEGKRAQIDAIEIDVSISEQHQSEVEITEHPVESGTNIVDHARPKPDTLTMECLISDDPMPSPSAPEIAQDYLGAQYMTKSQRREGRAGQAYEDLRALKNAGALITVVTALRTYENMMIRSLSIPRDSKVGRAIRFSASLLEVRVVSNKTVELKALSKVEGGKKATPEAPAAQKKTLLKDLSDTTGATGFFSGVLGG